jgi:hypothetical protein
MGDVNGAGVGFATGTTVAPRYALDNAIDRPREPSVQLHDSSEKSWIDRSQKTPWRWSELGAVNVVEYAIAENPMMHEIISC